MDQFFEIIKLILPAGIVLLTTYYLVNKFLHQESQKKALDLKLANQNILTPIRLQAYERVVLFLERINPSSMVMRANKNMSASSLQGELLKTIRSEFEHNLSQQIYMSSKSWDAAVKAKEETIKIINVAGAQINPDAPGMEMAQAVINISGQLSHLPSKDAIDIIKKEIAREF